MRALWTGSLNFGLINIPVKLYGAVDERGGIELDYVHKKDLTPIKYVRVCTHDGKEIPFDEIAKGYEYKEGMYVTLEEEDFERANLKAAKTIDLHTFTDASQIDSLYYDKSYFLLPDTGGEHAYAVLHEALSRAKKVGIATFVLRGRGRLGLVKAQGPVIVLQRMHYESEIRDPSKIDVPRASASSEEVNIARALIQFLTKPFNIRDYHDTYTEELQRMIDQKVRGKGPPPTKQEAETEPTKPSDLMKLLRASLEGQKGGRFSTKKTEPKGKKKKQEQHVD